MKRILFAMMVLVIAMFAMASCDNSNNEDKGDQNAGDNNTVVCAHEEVVEVLAVKATCTKDGKSEGTVCKKCGAVISGCNVIKAFNHKGTTVTIKATEATCQKAGSTEGKRCTSCLKILVPAVTIDKLDHTPEANKDVDATCTEPGSTGGTHCSVCFENLTDPTLTDPIKHDYQPMEEIAPTCQEDGRTGGVACTKCHKVAVEPTVVPKSDEYHDYEWTVDADDATKENGECKVEGCESTTQRDVVSGDENQNDENQAA